MGGGPADIVGVWLDRRPGGQAGGIAGLDRDLGRAATGRPAPTVGGEGGGDGDAEFILRAAGNPAAEFEAAAGEGIEHVEAAARGAQPRKGVDAAVVADKIGRASCRERVCQYV